MVKKYRWGILAPGKMSAKFTRGLMLLENAELYAVASREYSRAERFGREYGFRKFYGSYEELAADKEVDIIYIASPHSAHFENVMLCLNYDKAVLCEKALTINSHEAEIIFREAEKRKIFFMEAIWTPFQPMYSKTIKILEQGLAGELQHLNSRFSFHPPYDPADRKFDISLGGGCLLDIGIYPVIDALWFMGVPSKIIAEASFAASGTDDTVSAVFRYDDGRMATLYSSYKTSAGIGTDLFCARGNLYFSRGRDMSQRLLVEIEGKEREEPNFVPEGMGYHYEAMEVMKCLDEGRTESLVIPHSFSRKLINTLDRIRQEAGIIYPGRD
jgi:predicted dehydrogenase